MEWIRISEQKPANRENQDVLVTDGETVWIARFEEDEFWIMSDTKSDPNEIEDRLTHWAEANSVPLPDMY